MMSVVLTALLLCAVGQHVSAQQCSGGQVLVECQGCPQSCDPRIMCMPTAECSEGCMCPDDKPFWHNGRCIEREQCTAITECSGGQVWAECQGCPQTCEYTDIMCKMMCVVGCTCPADKPIWHHNQCITREECSVTCPGGQEWNSCGSSCTKTCEDPLQPFCILVCRAGCECPDKKPILHNGQCIKENQCPAIDICQLPMVIGLCKALMPSWYYDSALRLCKPFNYGGCNGNDNRFPTQADCEEECLIDPCEALKCAADEICVLTEVQCVTTPCLPVATCVSVCSMLSDSGPCEAATTRWYWDGTECQTFIYGGCDGNANNFERKRDCNRACKRPDKGK